MILTKKISRRQGSSFFFCCNNATAGVLLVVSAGILLTISGLSPTLFCPSIHSGTGGRRLLLSTSSSLPPVVVNVGLHSSSMNDNNINIKDDDDETGVEMSSKATIDPTATTTKIRWGIVGLGDVTQIKSGPPFWKCTGSELVAVMRRTPGKAAEFSQTRVPGNRCVGYETLTAMLRGKKGQEEKGGLEAIYIATRPGTHRDLATQIAQYYGAAAEDPTRKNQQQGDDDDDDGDKSFLGCYIEKPVGRCAAETEAIVALYAQYGFTVYTAYISRAYARTQALRTLLQDATVLGPKVVHIRYRLKGTGGARDLQTNTAELPWRLDPKESGGGLIMDVGCHILDRIDYLCGPLIDVQGHAEHRPQHDVDTSTTTTTNANKNKNTKFVVENYCELTAVIGPSSWGAKPHGGCEGATLEMSWDFSLTDEEDALDELIFIGSNGRSLKLQGMSPTGAIELIDTDGETIVETIGPFPAPEHTAQRLIQAVTNDLLETKQGRQKTRHDGSNDNNANTTATASHDVLSFGDNAIRTQRVIDTMLESYYGGREIGYWERNQAS